MKKIFTKKFLTKNFFAVKTLNNKRYFSSSSYKKLLTHDNISPLVLKAEYAVRGAIVVRANELQQQLKSNNHNLPFKKIIMCNIGNPQELGQLPLTFPRQVLATCLYPALLKSDDIPNAAKERARRILNESPYNTIGAYTHSQGLSVIRETVAKFIQKRDETNEITDIKNIFLTEGASPGIKYILQSLINSSSHGILIPIPQYPLYSATITLLGGTQIGYELNEEKGWSFDIDQAEKAVQNAKKSGIQPHAIVVINPGNPTGQVLTQQNIKDAIQLAKEHNLVILADEVYQENIYEKKKNFVSFRKTLLSMGKEYSKNVELCSFHSVSKGIFGECGLRGGYMELTNINNDGHEQIYKLVSVNLCPNIIGQIMVDLMCESPTKNDNAIYSLFKKEYEEQYQSLKKRALIISQELNKIKGISCQSVEGAMYAFPTITIPEKAVQEAKKKNMKADAFYALQLLEKTGICVVPGSGFGQKNGTYHIRTTLLPPENEIQLVVQQLGKFHTEFTKQWS